MTQTRYHPSRRSGALVVEDGGSLVEVVAGTVDVEDGAGAAELPVVVVPMSADTQPETASPTTRISHEMRLRQHRIGIGSC